MHQENRSTQALREAPQPVPWPSSTSLHGKKIIPCEPFGKGHSSLQDTNLPIKHQCLHAKFPSVLQAALESCVCLLFVETSLSWWLIPGRLRNIYQTGCPTKSPPLGTEEFKLSQQIPRAQRTQPVRTEENALTQSNSSSQDPGAAELHWNAFCQAELIPSPGSAHCTRHAQSLGFD